MVKELGTTMFAISVFMATYALNQSTSKITLKKLVTFNDTRNGAFSYDGKLLALIGPGHVDVVEIATNRRLTRIATGNATVLGIKFSIDGKYLAFADKVSENSQTNPFKISFWDISTGKEKLSLPTTVDQWHRNLEDLSFSPDGKLLACNLGGTPRFWRTVDGIEDRRFLPTDDKELSSERVLLSPDGNLLAVYFKRQSPQKELIRIWNLSNKNQLDLMTDVYRDWSFSNDSKLLAVTATQQKGLPGEHSAVEIWDLVSERKLKVIETPRDWKSAFVLSISPDSSIIAIGGYKKFGLFSAQSGELLASATHPKLRLFQDNEMSNELSDIEFSPDGKMLLTGGNDGTVKLWRVER